MEGIIRTEIFVKCYNATTFTIVWSRRVTWTIGLSVLASIATNGTHLFLAYADNTPGRYELYLKALNATTGANIYTKRLTYTSNQEELFPRITISGEYIYIAYYSRNYEGSSKLRLVKIHASSGEIEWNVGIATSSSSIFPHITTLGDAIYVAYVISGEVHLVKVDSSGSVVWDINYGYPAYREAKIIRCRDTLILAYYNYTTNAVKVIKIDPASGLVLKYANIPVSRSNFAITTDGLHAFVIVQKDEEMFTTEYSDYVVHNFVIHAIYPYGFGRSYKIISGDIVYSSPYCFEAAVAKSYIFILYVPAFENEGECTGALCLKRTGE